MNNSPDKNNPDKNNTDEEREQPPVNGDPKQRKVDPQLTELDGLKKGGVEPTVHQSDKALDEKGRVD